MAGTTVDLDDLEEAIRLRLLMYRSVTGSATLAERLTGGLHIGSPPDNADYQYGAMRVLNLRPHPINGPYFVGDLELQLWDRPRAKARALRRTMDVAVEALNGWVDLSLGVYQTDVRDRDELPPFSESADPEVIQSRTTFSVVLFPIT